MSKFQTEDLQVSAQSQEVYTENNESQSESDSSYSPSMESEDTQVTLIEDEDEVNEMKELAKEAKPLSRSITAEIYKIENQIFALKVCLLVIIVILILLGMIAYIFPNESCKQDDCWEKFKQMRCNVDNPEPGYCQKLFECVRKGRQQVKGIQIGIIAIFGFLGTTIGAIKFRIFPKIWNLAGRYGH